MDDTSDSYQLGHVTALKELLEELAPLSVELQEHSYHYLSFGSWVIVAGRRKHRYRFVWDGKESYLSVSHSTFSDSQSVAQWKELPEHCGPVSSSEAFGKVHAVLVGAYAARQVVPADDATSRQRG